MLNTSTIYLFEEGVNLRNSSTLHEEMTMPNSNLGIKVVGYSSNKYGEVVFENHWHEQIEILYFKSGSAVIECNSNPINVKPDELVVVNSNDLHRGTNLSADLFYYCIIIDPFFLYGNMIDICSSKYIEPIAENYIVFDNKITEDGSLSACINILIAEYENKEVGYELALKSCIYKLFTLLLRNHSAYTMTPAQFIKRISIHRIFNPILQYIAKRFNEDISVKMLSEMAGLSESYFCHLFKEFTGRTFSEYLNMTRVNKAEYMLRNLDMNISEVAIACGFNDANYFSRIYKRYKNASPSMVRKEKPQYQ